MLEHFASLKLEKHHCSELQLAWNKDPTNFDYFVLENRPGFQSKTTRLINKKNIEYIMLQKSIIEKKKSKKKNKRSRKSLTTPAIYYQDMRFDTLEAVKKKFDNENFEIRFFFNDPNDKDWKYA